MLARHRLDEWRGGESGKAVQRIRRSPCGRALVAADIEDDAGPMAYGRRRGKLAERRSADAPGCDTDAV